MFSPMARPSKSTSIPTGPLPANPATMSTPLVTSASCRLRFTRASATAKSSCCPQTGNGPASASATHSSSPATSSMSIWPTPPKAVRRRATLEQDSGAQGALLAMDNTTGDVLAMVGGRDFALSQFNRATQAERQTGSSFKPYVYTTAMEDGAKPTDIIVDAPVSFGSYTPHNYENDFKGADDPDQRLCRVAQHSRRQAGRARRHSQGHRHGAPLRRHVRHSRLLAGRARRCRNHAREQVDSYSVFPNDGIRVTPRLIRKVSNSDGITLWQDRPEVNEVISQQTARTMMTLFRAVTASRHRRRRRRSSTILWAARPAPPATSPTHGSSASRPPSPAASGLATTAAIARRKRDRRSRRLCPSGWTSCAPPSSAARRTIPGDQKDPMNELSPRRPAKPISASSPVPQPQPVKAVVVKQLENPARLLYPSREEPSRSSIPHGVRVCSCEKLERCAIHQADRDTIPILWQAGHITFGLTGRSQPEIPLRPRHILEDLRLQCLRRRPLDLPAQPQQKLKFKRRLLVRDRPARNSECASPRAKPTPSNVGRLPTFVTA